MVEYNLSGLDVLILDQHIPMRNLLRRVVRELGIKRIHDIDSPNEAFDIIKDKPIDLILCDWSPTLDGMAFLKRVRTADDSPNQCVSLIVVSAYTEFHYICTARDLGMTEYLAKPISATSLYGRIRSIIEKEREFISSAEFFGPDRRRRDVDFGDTDRRVDTAA